MQQLLFVLVLCLLISCRNATANNEEKQGSAVLIQMPPAEHRQYLDSLNIHPFKPEFIAEAGCRRFFREEYRKNYILATDTAGNAYMQVDNRKVHLVKTGKRIEQDRVTIETYSSKDYHLSLMIYFQKQVSKGVYEYTALLTIENKGHKFTVKLIGEVLC